MAEESGRPLSFSLRPDPRRRLAAPARAADRGQRRGRAHGGPGGAPGRRACCSACSARCTRSSPTRCTGEIASLPAGRAGRDAAGPGVPRAGARRGPLDARPGPALRASARRLRRHVRARRPARLRARPRHQPGGPGRARRPRSHRPGLRPPGPATTGGPSSTCRCSTTPTATSTPRARCWPTPTPSPAWATAGPTSAPSATPASPPRCWPCGAATATAAGSELPYLVRQHTQDTARTVGLHDRGVLAPGYRADVNVIDFDALAARRPEIVHDLPAGGRRLVQEAEGYVATVVAGQVTYEHGEATGPLPGRLVRGPQPAPRRCAMTRRPRWSEHCEWHTDELGDRYVFHLTDEHVAELDAALVHAESQVDDVLDITRDVLPPAHPGARAGPPRRRPDQRARRGPDPGRAGRALQQGPAPRPSTGASACTSASPGPRTPRATCWAT